MESLEERKQEMEGLGLSFLPHLMMWTIPLSTVIIVSHTPSSNRGEARGMSRVYLTWLALWKDKLYLKGVKVDVFFLRTLLWALGEPLHCWYLLSTVPLTWVNILFPSSLAPRNLEVLFHLLFSDMLAPSKQTCEQLPKTSLHPPGRWPTSCARDSSTFRLNFVFRSIWNFPLAIVNTFFINLIHIPILMASKLVPQSFCWSCICYRHLSAGHHYNKAVILYCPYLHSLTQNLR